MVGSDLCDAGLCRDGGDGDTWKFIEGIISIERGRYLLI